MRPIKTALILLASCWLVLAPGQAGPAPIPAKGLTPENARLLREKLQMARPFNSMSDRTFAVARSFIGTPYVAGLLDESGEENLVVNLQALDCWTFVENSVAIAQTAADSTDVETAYTRHLQQLRYRNGVIDGYGSRLHYFSSWLQQAEKKGLLQDITHALGGEACHKTIAYMSAHPEHYPKLKDPKLLRQIRATEQELSRRTFYFIPQDGIDALEDRLLDGDIIAILSAKTGLDFAHEGFALRRNGRVHLLHASSLGKRVMISNQALGDYVRSQKGQIGIVVARIAERGGTWGNNR